MTTPNESIKILIVDDEKNIRESLGKVLNRENFQSFLSADALEAEEVLEQVDISLVLSDLLMPKVNGIELLKRIKQKYPQTEVVLITGHATVERAVEAMREGAADFITKPFRRADIIHRVYKALEKRQLAQKNHSPAVPSLQSQSSGDVLIGRSIQIQNIVKLIERVAPLQSTVLITGESGTGKEIIARLIHSKSSRANKLFSAVNCGAIAESVIESELFGQIKGAFTGAISDIAEKYSGCGAGNPANFIERRLEGECPGIEKCHRTCHDCM